MDINEELYDLIERYLEGSLTEGERLAFEKRLAENPELNVQTEKIRAVNELIFSAGLEKELPQIKAAEQMYVRQNYIKTFGKWFGGIVVVAAVGWMAVSSMNTSDKISVENNLNKLPITGKEIITQGKRIDSLKQSGAVHSKNSKDVKEEFLTIPIAKNTEPVVLPTPKEELTDVVELKTSSPQLNSIPVTIENMEAVLPCKGLLIGSFETKPSCPQINDGSIIASSIQGGDPPYLFSLNGGMFEKREVYNFLSPGEYQLQIKDKNGCFSERQQVVVKEKACLPKGQDFVVSFQKTPEWSLPEVNEEEYQFAVFNSSGMRVYTNTIMNGIPSQWNGLDNTNQKLPNGFYTFRCMKENKIVMQGTLTLVD